MIAYEDDYKKKKHRRKESWQKITDSKCES